LINQQLGKAARVNITTGSEVSKLKEQMGMLVITSGSQVMELNEKIGKLMIHWL
jgi:hypothetical protein